MNKLNFSVIWKIYMFTNATNKFLSLVMTGLADVDGFEICIHDCILPGFGPLTTSISKCSSYLRLIVIWLLLDCFRMTCKRTNIAALDVLIALFTEHDYHKTKDPFVLYSQPDFSSSLNTLENPRSIDCYVNWESQCHITQLSRIAKYKTRCKKVKKKLRLLRIHSFVLLSIKNIKI